MHFNGKPNPARQLLDVVVIGEALTDVVITPGGAMNTPAGHRPTSPTACPGWE